jgi:hypothetical protein
MENLQTLWDAQNRVSEAAVEAEDLSAFQASQAEIHRIEAAIREYCRVYNPVVYMVAHCQGV